MDYRKLGQTDLEVSALSFGAATFGDAYGRLTQTDATTAVSTAIEHGINYFDTAPYYGDGLSERMLGQALKGKRDAIILATKAGQSGTGDTMRHDMSADNIRASVNASLQRLQTDWIDLCQLHDIDMDDPALIINESLPTLLELKKTGKIRYIGITAYTIKTLVTVARGFPVDCVLTFCHYDLLDRTMMDTLVPFARDAGIGVINASPLHMGVLTDEVPPDWHPVERQVLDAVDEARSMCSRFDTSIATLALQYAYQNQDVTTTLIGMKTADQVTHNIKAISEPIQTDLLTRVQRILAPVQDIPLVER